MITVLLVENYWPLIEAVSIGLRPEINAGRVNLVAAKSFKEALHQLEIGEWAVIIIDDKLGNEHGDADTDGILAIAMAKHREALRIIIPSNDDEMGVPRNAHLIDCHAIEYKKSELVGLIRGLIANM